MKVAKKILLSLCGLFFICLMLLAGAAGYLYAHPSRVKGLVEASLSDAIGASVTLGELHYAIRPFHLAAEGISVRPGSGLHGISLDAPDFRADLSLTGPFTRKTLVVQHLEVTGFSCRILKDEGLRALPTEGEAPSLFNAFLRRLVALFLFRDIDFREVDLSGGDITIASDAQTIRATRFTGHLDQTHRIQISFALAFTWPSRKAHLSIPSLRIRTAPAISLADPVFSGRVTLDEGILESPGADFRGLKADATVAYRRGPGTLDFEGVGLTLKSLHIKQDDGKASILPDLHLQGGGVFDLKNDQLTLRPLKATVSDGLTFDGELRADLGAKKTVAVEIRTCRLMPQNLRPSLPPEIEDRIHSIKLKGPVHLSGKLQARQEKDRWGLDTDLTLKLNQNPIALAGAHARASGQLTGSLQGRGRFPKLDIWAKLKADHLTASGGGVKLKPSRVDLAISGTYPKFHVKDFSAQIQAVSASFGNRTYRLHDIYLKSTEGRINAATRAWSLPEMQLNTAMLKNLRLSLEGTGSSVAMKLRGKNTGLLTWTEALALLPKGWRVSGADVFAFRGHMDKSRKATFSLELDFPQMAFQNQESTIMGDKIRMKGTIHGETDPKAGRIFAEASLNADGGEALVSRFYVNLKNSPLSARLKGTYHTGERDLWLSRFSVGLKDIFSCQADGKVFYKDREWRVDLSTHIPDTPLKPIFRFFVSEPFQVENPFLKHVGVGGTVWANLDLSGRRSDWRFKGNFSWRSGDVHMEEKKISLEGIDLSLPLYLSVHQAANPLQENLRGNLSIRSVHVPLLPQQGLDLPLEAGPNRLSIPSPMILKAPGGAVQIQPIDIKDLMSTPVIRTGLSLERFDVEPLLKTIWPQPIKGSLAGTLDPIVVKSGRLTCSGDITAKVFGGVVIMSDPGIWGLFTGTPVFKMNCRWKHLNLQELTAGTEFGKIQGVLNGYAKNLEIAQGQPQKFDLFLETVRSDHIPQRISIKAVDNIAHLGGGRSPFVGAAGVFASLFKEFPYKKIGVRATLENDVFTINGTIHENGKEYLVKRGLFSGVNVVNQNPDNRVSFKDMIKRFKRVTSAKGGPVIK